jgi:hypothetical protein
VSDDKIISLTKRIQDKKLEKAPPSAVHTDKEVDDDRLPKVLTGFGQKIDLVEERKKRRKESKTEIVGEPDGRVRISGRCKEPHSDNEFEWRFDEQQLRDFISRLYHASEVAKYKRALVGRAEFRLIIAGSRNLSRNEVGHHLVSDMLRESGFVPTMILCGECKGPDHWGAEWAAQSHLEVKHYPVAKGPRRNYVFRNEAMAVYAHGLLAIWDGKSAGTKDMIERAISKKLRTFVYRTDLKKGYWAHE